MRLVVLLCVLFSVALPATARDFTVLVYNVENLTAPFGHAAAINYGPKRYSREHMLTRLNNIARIAAQFDGGQGPDVILFQEIERDMAQDQYLFDDAGMLRRYEDMTIEEMLDHYENPAIARIPVEGLLLKTFYDRGLRGYRVAVADDPIQAPDRRDVAYRNIIFTRFPIGAVHSYLVPHMPAILEVQVDVGAYPLYLFDNHWKGDPMSAADEDARVDAAKVLRSRIDEVFSVNPSADIIVAGDFNSFCDQALRFHYVKTALSSVLGSQGDKRALRDSTAFYNLWYELPRWRRGSEVYHGVWSTFMQILVSRGLFDYSGVQYVDGSFDVAEFSGLNTDEQGEPLGWSLAGIKGSGFSVHFPLCARFTTVRDNRTDMFLNLELPPSEPAELSR